MNLLFFVAIALTIASTFVTCLYEDDLDMYWLQYKTAHNKQYASNDEEIARRIVWEENLEYIIKHNMEASYGKHTYRLGMNRFGDLTNQEFVEMIMNGFKQKEPRTFNQSRQATLRATYSKPVNAEIPDSVDWRTKGYVTPVQNEGQCGMSVPFAALASLEGQQFKKSGKLVPLSDQQLIDCLGKTCDCEGDLFSIDEVFQYIKDNNGIDTAAGYPGSGPCGVCKFDPTKVGARVTGIVDVKSGDEEALTSALASVGPISCYIDASHPSCQL